MPSFKISLNNIGELGGPGSASRRKAIVSDAVQGSGGPSMYASIEKVARQCFIKPAESERLIFALEEEYQRAREALNFSSATTEDDYDQLSIKAKQATRRIEALHRLYEVCASETPWDWGDYEFSKAWPRPDPFVSRDVSVPGAFDLYVIDKRTGYRGAIKFRFNGQLRDDLRPPVGAITATVIRQILVQQQDMFSDVSNRLCMSIDVLGGRVYTPTNITDNMQRVHKACRAASAVAKAMLVQN